MHNIFIADKPFTFEWLTNPGNEGAQTVLRRAKEGGEYPECGCSKRRPKMYIAKKKASGKYYLARMPDTAGTHQPNCLLSRETESNKSGGEAVEAITKDANGIRITLDGELSHRTSTPNEVSESSYTKARVSKNSITLLGLLELLWEQARFNFWYPNRKYPRTWSTVKRVIEEQANEHKIRVSGKALNNILYIPAPFNKKKPEHHETLNTAALTLVTKSKDDGFIAIGELKECLDRNGSTLIKLKHAGNQTAFWMHKALADRFKNSFANEISDLGNENIKVIAIMIGYKPANSLSVSAIGLMRVTPEYIPIDSSYEAQVVEKLVAENRKFRKPLRYDSEDEVLPDFELLDCEQDCIPMEVFGMKGNAEYDLRKAEKVKFYNENHGLYGWWSWNAADNLSIPEFSPPKNNVNI